MPSFCSNNTTHVEQPDLFSCDFPSTKELTVLSYGAGQESTWLLYKTILDKDFRRRFAPGRFVVIGSDTGDKHDDSRPLTALTIGRELIVRNRRFTCKRWPFGEGGGELVLNFNL